MTDLLHFIIDSSAQFRRARLPSLYSDFTLQRTSNPDGFVANVSAWENALRKAAQAGLIPSPGDSHDTLSLRTSEELLQALTTKEWGRPLALGTVVDEAVAKRHMMPLQEFLDAPTSIYARSWRIKPWWLLTWGLQQLGIFENHTMLGKLPNARYVLITNVEEAASKVLAAIALRTNLVDRIYPRQSFGKEASRAMGLQGELTDSDFEVLLKHLARDRNALVYDDEIIKFKSPNEPLAHLSSEDKTISSLKTLISNLNSQITALEARILSLNEKTQASIKSSNKIAALAALRSRKAAETTIKQRYGTLEQLEGVYNKIEQASDNVAVVKVMEASTGVLRDLHGQVGGVENVEDVVEGLRDEMSKVNDISQVMEEAGYREAAIDEDEIDEEFAALERQDRQEKEEKETKERRQKLAGLETPRAPIGTTEDSRVPTMQPEDSKVADDTQALRRLSLDEAPSDKQMTNHHSTKRDEALPASLQADF